MWEVISGSRDGLGWFKKCVKIHFFSVSVGEKLKLWITDLVPTLLVPTTDWSVCINMGDVRWNMGEILSAILSKKQKIYHALSLRFLQVKCLFLHHFYPKSKVFLKRDESFSRNVAGCLAMEIRLHPAHLSGYEVPSRILPFISDTMVDVSSCRVEALLWGSDGCWSSSSALIYVINLYAWSHYLDHHQDFALTLDSSVTITGRSSNNNVHTNV